MPNSDKRQDLDRIGLFSEASYISSKEPFKDRRNNEGFLANRAKGKQFLTTPPRRGHDTRDVYFDKDFIRLFEARLYAAKTNRILTWWFWRRRYRLQQKEKNIANVPFKPSSVPPKPSGSGSLFGTIEQQWPLPKKDLIPMRSAPTEEKRPSKPNFLTKPPKKGTGYGYPNVTIGKPYEYVSDPYDRYLEIARKDRLESKKKMIGERAFISSSAKVDFFNAFAGLIGEKKSGTTPLQARQRNQNALPPFKPSSCCGYTINKYPAFELPTGASENAKVAEKLPRKLEPIFRPSGISKSYPIRSIIEATCPIAPPDWLQELISVNINTARRNEVGIQMIPERMRHHLFGKHRLPGQDQVKLANRLLEKFKLAGKVEAESEPFDFDLPPLSGKVEGIEDHFRVLGTEQSKKFKELALELALKPPPRMPKTWVFQAGWTCYDKDGPRSVDYPDEEAIVFDVETLPQETPLSVLAVAASSTTWYSGSRLVSLEEREEKMRERCECQDQRFLWSTLFLWVPQSLNASLARVLEEYHFESNKCGWIDTMSLHTAVGGLSTQQRAAWLKNRKETAEAIERIDDGDDGDTPDEVMDSTKAWMLGSSMRSLSDLADFYLNIKLSKEQRNVFVKGSWDDILEDFQSLMTYCARDVLLTHEKCPHPVSFAGMMEMGKMILTTSESWSNFITSAESKFQANSETIETELMKVAHETLNAEKWEDDPWLRNLNWTLPSARAKNLTDKPQWYRDLWDKNGWTFRVPREDAKKFAEKPLDMKGDNGVDNIKYVFFRIPHRDGDKNVGNPLSKPFLKSLESGILTSSNPRAKEILLLNSENSYWLSARQRITSQLVIDVSDINPNMPAHDDKRLHVIVPQVIAMGTVTRRAVESTWLTASNAKVNRIGSELKALVEAPKDYFVVGADVDSEELWICALIGDSQFRIHGATPLGFMTLQGNKKNRTDLHSVTGDIVGITRDAAKVFNYSRLYGAGIKHTIDLLAKNSPGTPRDELKQKAAKLFLETKGTKQRSKEAFWYGGTESYMFNELERIAKSTLPATPVLGCKIPDSLLPDRVNTDFLTTRINWIVQSSGVDYLHLLLVSMNYLMRRMKLRGRFMLSIHDEVRFLVHKEDAVLAAFALNISNLWTRALFATRLGMDDLPQNVGFFSAVDVDSVLRKEVDMDCITPSNPMAIPKGISYTMEDIMKDLRDRKEDFGTLFGDELPSVIQIQKELPSLEISDSPNIPEVNVKWLETQMAERSVRKTAVKKGAAFVRSIN
ncbi:DNA polymerase family A-domain-containing protein [Chytridium lagenaria]|nr:DNA polymerase family A-domain-containing protein [Chytridium lagenaria]